MSNTKMKKVWERRVVDIDDVRSRETRLRLHLTGVKAQAAHPSTVHLQSMPAPRHGRKSVIGSDDSDDTNCARVRTRGRTSRRRQTKNIDSRNPGQSGGFLPSGQWGGNRQSPRIIRSENR